MTIAAETVPARTAPAWLVVLEQELPCGARERSGLRDATPMNTEPERGTRC